MNHPTRKLLAAAAAAILGVGLAACDDTSTAPADAGPLPVVQSTTAPAEIELPQSTRERLFLEVMRDRGIPADVDLAESICDVLDLGVDPDTVIAMGVDNGLPAYDVGFVLGASVAAFCPQHDGQIGEQS